MRNVLNKIRPKDKNQVSIDLKEVFNNFDSNSCIAEALKKLKTDKKKKISFSRKPQRKKIGVDFKI